MVREEVDNDYCDEAELPFRDCRYRDIMQV